MLVPAFMRLAGRWNRWMPASPGPPAAAPAALAFGAVAPRRPTLRFGSGPFLLGLRLEEQRAGFPFEIPSLQALDRLRLDRPVTLLAGENGIGKSTIVEAVAQAMGFPDEGGELDRPGEPRRPPRPVLDGALAPVLTAHKPRGGFFLRAESFFNVAQFVDSDDKFAPDLSLYGDVPLHG
jgi:AAA domain